MDTRVMDLGIQYRRLYDQHILEHRCSARSCKEAMHLWMLSLEKARQGLATAIQVLRRG